MNSLTRSLCYCYFRHEDQQISNPVDLKEGHSYYIEAMMSETTGRDHLTIGVKLPDGKTFKPVPKQFLSPVRIGKHNSMVYICIIYFQMGFSRTELYSPLHF